MTLLRKVAIDLRWSVCCTSLGEFSQRIEKFRFNASLESPFLPYFLTLSANCSGTQRA